MRHEWRTLITERVVQATVAIFIAAAVLAFVNTARELPARQQLTDEASTRQHESHAKARETLDKDERELVQKGESLTRFKTFETSPWNLQTETANFTAVLPPAKLALAAVGGGSHSFSYQQYRDDSPTQPTIEDRSLGNVVTEKPTFNPLSKLIGRFDLAFATLYLFPLIILALSFNLIAAEKENGTLALLLSKPVSLQQIVLGKSSLRIGLVFACGVLLPGLLIGLGQRLVLGEVDLWRLLLWGLAVTAYGAFWFALAVWINSFGLGSSRNALTLAVCWIAFAFLIPAGINLMAEMAAPQPSKIRFADTERAARLEGNAKFYRTVNTVYDAFNRRYPRGKEDSPEETERERARMEDPAPIPENEDLLASYFARHSNIDSKSLSVNQLMYAATSAREEYIESRLQPLLQEASESRERRQFIVTAFSFLSPTALVQRVLIDLSGTGTIRYNHFAEQFDHYVRGRSDVFASKMMAGERITASEMNSLLPFNYREESNWDVTSRTAAPIFTVLFVSLTLFLFSAQRINRYEIVG